MRFKIIFITIIAILLVVFALQNTEVVITKLWFWEIKSQCALLILTSMIAGVIIGMASSLEIEKLKSKKKESEKVGDKQ